jgi:hypothetical protein
MHHFRTLLPSLVVKGSFAIVLVALASVAGVVHSEAEDGTLYNCPPAGQWAISVWSGGDAAIGDALDTCGEDSVSAAYFLHPLSQAWRSFFQGRPDVSDLTGLVDMQTVLALGSPTAEPPAAQPPSGPSPGDMRNCPNAGKWAMSAWGGPHGTDAEDALATCKEVIALAYYLDPETQTWLRYVHDRPELTTLDTLDNLQGVFALGSTEPKDYCAINIPGTYHGAVTIDGQPAPVGTVIRVLRGGIEFGSTTVAEEGVYTVNVPTTAPLEPPCFERTPGPLTFVCGDAFAQEQPNWSTGLRSQDLTCVPMANCPAAAKWSIAVYNGPEASIGDALGMCAVPVESAYRVDPDTQVWSRYFRGRPEISTLASLAQGHGFIALGSPSAAISAAGAAAPAETPGEGQILGCPQPGKWAISAWDGPIGTDIEDALDTCAGVSIRAAYTIDAQSQAWKRYFPDRLDLSNLSALGYMQGLLTLASSEAAAQAAAFAEGP